jgi:hypothetical protein
MPTLGELIGQCVTPEVFARREPSVTSLTAPRMLTAGAKRFAEYEAEVFNFLLDNKAVLGVEAVLAFKNLLVDGAAVLANGRRFAIEIKLRMNWEKACQAEWEFRHFLLKKEEARRNPVNGGIVFFEEFLADWQRRFACRQLENGWSHWYDGHSTAVQDAEPEQQADDAKQ